MSMRLQSLIMWTAVMILIGGCAAREMDPQILVGASESRAVLVSTPDRSWRAEAEKALLQTQPYC